MKITCNHPASSYGIPVVLDDNGEPMEPVEGVLAAIKKLGWSRHELATRCGYSNPRSIETVLTVRKVPPSAQMLNVLAVALSD